MFLMVEAVRQLRGEAGDRQVADAEGRCVHGTGGWFSSAATLLLGRLSWSVARVTATLELRELVDARGAEEAAVEHGA